MPSSLTCDMCGQEAAVAMVTSLANGDSLAVGEACQLTFHLTVAAELIKATPPELADQYIDQVNQLIDAYSQLGAAEGILGAGAAADEDPITGDLVTYPRAGLADDAGSQPHDPADPQAPAERTSHDNGTAPADQPADDAATPDDHVGAPDR